MHLFLVNEKVNVCVQDLTDPVSLQRKLIARPNTIAKILQKKCFFFCFVFLDIEVEQKLRKNFAKVFGSFFI